MVWKKIEDGNFGRRDVFGGEDIDKISKYFDGTPQVDNVDINSNTTIRSGKFAFANPTSTFTYPVTPSAITADRNLTLPVLTGNDTFLFENAVQTMPNKILTNCEFNATVTPMSRFAGDPTRLRWGTIMPKNAAATTTGVAAFDGMLSRHTLRNPNGTPEVDYMFPGEWYGYNGQFFRLENTSSNGDWCGIVSPSTGVGLCRLSHDGLIRVRWQQEDTDFAAFWCGLSSNASAAPLNYLNPLSNSESGIMIGNSTFHGEWGEMVHYHNGDGTTPHKQMLVSGTKLQMDAEVFNDLEIKWWHDFFGTRASASVKSSVKGATRYGWALIETDIPADNTDLYFHCHLINTGNDSQTLGIGSVWIESF